MQIRAAVGGIGVGSTHSKSSRSVEAEEIVRDEKPIAISLLVCDAGTGAGHYRIDGVVLGAAFWPLSQAARKERGGSGPMMAHSPASKSTKEFSALSSRVSPSPSPSATTAASLLPGMTSSSSSGSDVEAIVSVRPRRGLIENERKSFYDS